MTQETKIRVVSEEDAQLLIDYIADSEYGHYLDSLEEFCDPAEEIATSNHIYAIMHRAFGLDFIPYDEEE